VIAYKNLDLRIRADGDRLVVDAQRGNAQAVSESFKLPSRSWNLEEIELGGPDEIKKRGSELFKALIHGQVKDLYHQSRGGTGSDARRGMRIRIQIDPRNPRLRPLMRVPWEILYDASADANRWVALDARRAVVRMIDSSEPHVKPEAGELKRVLLAAANPADTDRLKLSGELKRVSDILCRHDLRPVILERTTRSVLLERIGESAPQIVHFMGHGSIDSRHGKGVLLLEGNRRAKDEVDAPTFASFFVGRAMPRLVILNSCLTAATGRARTFNAFSSVAAALIAVGMPAVIAMQSTIRDDNAIKFTEALYGALVRGDSIEDALSQARAALSARNRFMLDWAAPVLYVRAQGGQVVEKDQAKNKNEMPPVEKHSPDGRSSHKNVVENGIQINDSTINDSTINAIQAAIKPTQ
jgi:CHAT domain